MTLTNYSPIPQNEVIDTLDSMIGVGSTLEGAEKIKYSSETVTTETEIEKEAKISVKKIEESRTSQTIENQIEIILKIKKPDFIGESKWEFKHGKKTISAKILDINWIEQFHSKIVNVQPGDSFKAYTHIIEYYDKYGSLINDEYTILEIREIISGVLE